MTLHQIGGLVAGALLVWVSASVASEQQQRAPAAEPWPDGAAGFLLARATDRELRAAHPVDAALAAILDRQGPDMRPLHDAGPAAPVPMAVAQRAWRLMRQHAQSAAADRVRLVWPLVEAVLRDANVTGQCRRAAHATAQAAHRFESWAIQLLSAWGSFPPAGIFEGTFADIGSYHGCIDVPENAHIGHAHYCSLAYRPVMPTRPDYELIVRKEAPELRHLFDGAAANGSGAGSGAARDAFADLLENAQYSHYVYYKLGACFPIACSPRDVQAVARLLGRRAILVSGPVKCYSKFATDYQPEAEVNGTQALAPLQISTRDLNAGVYVWRPHMTRAQKVALALLAAVTAVIGLMTLLDIVLNRVPAFGAALARSPRAGSGPPAPGDALASGKASRDITGHAHDTNNNDTQASFEMHAAATGDEPEVHTLKPPDRRALGEARRGGGAIAGDARDAHAHRSLLAQLVVDCSVLTNARQFVRVSQSELSNDIPCLNGIRCITMSWIIVTHTMQYNDWSAFARTREIETHLNSLVNQPVFNASYLVDTFFLVSGLLAAYSHFKAARGRLCSRSYLVGRYLRLTPQIGLASLLFIVLPLLASGAGSSPHWFTMTGEYSENCADNWWVNLLHIQAFYRSSHMCNFVCWWISVDMLYHLLAFAALVLAVRLGARVALQACALAACAAAAAMSARHYQQALPPNLLSTIPQTGAMWSQMTLGFFWMPYAHALPFALGFAVGFLLARRARQLAAWLSWRRALAGWALCAAALLAQSYSTYFWVVGRWRYSRLAATAFYLVCPLVWSSCVSWIIVACHCARGGPVQRLLSCRLFVVLGKASYVVYLTHFLVLFTFFGSQNLLLEPTRLTMMYVMLGNILLSMLLGSVLCIVFEMPWLKLHKRIMRRLR